MAVSGVRFGRGGWGGCFLYSARKGRNEVEERIHTFTSSKRCVRSTYISLANCWHFDICCCSLGDQDWVRCTSPEDSVFILVLYRKDGGIILHGLFFFFSSSLLKRSSTKKEKRYAFVSLQRNECTRSILFVTQMENTYVRFLPLSHLILATWCSVSWSILCNVVR